jgi:hypothetical protein
MGITSNVHSVQDISLYLVSILYAPKVKTMITMDNKMAARELHIRTTWNDI